MQDSLRASNFYVPPAAKISADARQPTVMRRGGYSTYRGRGVRGGGRSPPPDLPSLLLDSRIVFIGMPLVASVTELIVSELLWLQYYDPKKPIHMYINSKGSQQDMQAIAFDTEAYAILDTMNVWPFLLSWCTQSVCMPVYCQYQCVLNACCQCTACAPAARSLCLGNSAVVPCARLGPGICELPGPVFAHFDCTHS
jgi:hypothetical protein